jgi:hypothetical protein
MIANPNITWEILGFTDCQGDETLNTSLRISRATSLYLALPDAAKTQIDRFYAAPLTDCIRNNISEENRRLNRSVIIRQKSVTYDFEPEVVDIPNPAHICGPDITDWLIERINRNRISAEVTEMRERNDADITGVDLGAVYDWYELVKTGGPWDFKEDLGSSISNIRPCRRNCSGRVFSITLDDQCMTFEVAANIHFGFVGRAAGFSESLLLRGAGIAQIAEFRGESRDDSRDVQAIEKGFHLFNTGSPNGLDKSGLERNYYDQLPVGDGDPDGCLPCSKKLSP